jgi:hypothetical protein
MVKVDLHYPLQKHARALASVRCVQSRDELLLRTSLRRIARQERLICIQRGRMKVMDEELKEVGCKEITN